MPRHPVPPFALAALLLALALSGCASRGPAPVDGRDWTGPVPQGYYLVRNGDTLGGIAKKRGLSKDKLARWNSLKPPYTLYAGRLLRVAPPGTAALASGSGGHGPKSERRDGSRKSARSAAGAKKAQTSARAAAPARPGSRAAASGLRWDWPLRGSIIQLYRPGDRTRQGLRIACRSGEQVRATAAGTVVYSGSGLKGYGNLIIVKHNEKYLSAYGFNRRLFVREGDGVRRGQAVAECGQGPDGVYLLHFEVRRDGAAVDPFLYLPPRIQPLAASAEGDVDVHHRGP